jgi:hypothetical protein
MLRNEEIKIYCGTWNMAGNQPPKNLDLLNDLFPPDQDIYAFACQESDNSITKVVQQYLKDYITITSLVLLEIRLIVLTKEEHLSKISNIEQSSKATGFLNIIGIFYFY